MRMLGIRWEDLPREQAAADLLALDLTVKWRPLILVAPPVEQ